MKDSVVEQLRKAEKVMVKLQNNIKRADLNYTVQISVSKVDPTVIRYAAQMTSPAEGLAPITFIANTPDELVEQIKNAAKGIDYESVEIAYHEAQIKACKRTIQYHEERIENIKNPKEEESEEENGQVS